MSVAVLDRDFAPDQTAGEGMPSGVIFSAGLHLLVLLLVIFGLPKLFHQPPPEDTPIAVQLVTIAPETRATHPNPYRPKAEAKPDLPVAPPAPKPELKPEPPVPSPQPPPSAAAAPPPPPAPEPPKPEPPKPEAKTPPPPLPPPPKPVEAQTPPPPVPHPPEPRPKPEPKPRPQMAARPERKPDPAAFQQLMKNLSQRAEKKPDPAAFDAMTKQLTEKKQEPAAFDSLLKNLTRDQPPPTEDMPPQPHRRQMAMAAPASSQPKAPLGSQLTASEKDLIIQQIERCWVVPAGARDADNLIIEIKAVLNPDGTVRQASIVDGGRYNADAFFRAAADSAKRAVLNPNCSPLHVPPDKFEQWRNLDLYFNPKDLL